MPFLHKSYCRREIAALPVVPDILRKRTDPVLDASFALELDGAVEDLEVFRKAVLDLLQQLPAAAHRHIVDDDMGAQGIDPEVMVQTWTW